MRKSKTFNPAKHDLRTCEGLQGIPRPQTGATGGRRGCGPTYVDPTVPAHESDVVQEVRAAAEPGRLGGRRPAGQTHGGVEHTHPNTHHLERRGRSFEYARAHHHALRHHHIQMFPVPRDIDNTPLCRLTHKQHVITGIK